MTWLERLESVVRARTKGPWRKDTRFCNVIEQHPDHVQHAVTCDEFDVGFTGWRNLVEEKSLFKCCIPSLKQVESNVQFIALMGTVADELLEVVKAAANLRDKPVTSTNRDFEILDEAVDALRKKLETP